jgi:TolB protein
LTDGASNNTDAVWSPDGNHIAFVSDRDGVDSIYVMGADGGHVRRLTRGNLPVHLPAWSPDGKQIAYSAQTGENIDIFAANADGTNPVNLTRHPVYNADPNWSPDGKHLVFASNSRSETNTLGKFFGLFVMNADGSHVRPLSTRNNPSGFLHPMWSPDGRKLAYGDFAGQGVELFVCDADGNNQKQLTHLGGTNTRPSWTPDGARIAFRHLGGGAANSTLFILSADGSNLREIRAPIQGGDSGRLLWKPR